MIDAIVDFFKNIPNMINELKDFIVELFIFLNSVVNFLPTPFNTIFYVVLFVFAIILSLKIARGWVYVWDYFGFNWFDC